jgi:hypothetical protein
VTAICANQTAASTSSGRPNSKLCIALAVRATAVGTTDA